MPHLLANVAVDNFLKGGPIMWPLLLTSIVSLSVVLERLVFILTISLKRQPRVVETILSCVEKGDVAGAIEIGRAHV